MAYDLSRVEMRDTTGATQAGQQRYRVDALAATGATHHELHQVLEGQQARVLKQGDVGADLAQLLEFFQQESPHSPKCRMPQPIQLRLHVAPGRC